MRLTLPHYYDFGPDRDLLGGDLLPRRLERREHLRRPAVQLHALGLQFLQALNWSASPSAMLSRMVAAQAASICAWCVGDSSRQRSRLTNRSTRVDGWCQPGK